MKKGIFKVLCILLACMMLFTAGAYAHESNKVIGNGNVIVFVDVPNGYWAKEQIDYFTQKGIINGFGDGTFKPDEGVKREEFCKLLVTSFDAPLSTPDEPTFTDVAKERWSYAYVEVCSEFLTGYANPFGGKPAFHPEEYATREDIAVALVRMMGYTDKDVENEKYALRKFRDGNTISPNLLGYVSLACEKGLINGYPDGTFGPNKGITRAETVVLLNRATKQAVTNINAELALTANVIYGNKNKSVTINVVSEEGATATVNGEAIVMSSNHYDAYEGNYLYTFEEEGTKEFVVTAKKGTKEKTVTVSAKYEIDAPILNIEYCPSTTTERTIELKGYVSGGDHHVTLTLNGKKVGRQGMYNSMSWTEKFTLEEGENTLTFLATNALGKTTEIVRTVTLTSDAPKLLILSCPETTTNKYANVSGQAIDNNFPFTVTVNGTEVGYSSGGSYIWNYDGELSEGENVLEIVVSSLSGKSTKEVRKVTLNVDGPELEISTCPSSVYDEKVTIKGRAYDSNYGVTVTINGEEIDSSDNGSVYFETTVNNLSEGENEIVIAAKNSLGKVTTVTKTVTYIIEGPKLKITSCPETVTRDYATIRGTASDWDYGFSVLINGEVIDTDESGGSISWSENVELAEGENSFVIEVKSESGKSAKETVVINFDVEVPDLEFFNCPEITTDEKLGLRVKVLSNSSDAKLYIDDELTTAGAGSIYTKNVVLKEGDNQFVFRVVNGYGKSKTIVKNVKLVAEITAPEIVVNEIPEETTTDNLEISGTLTDTLDDAAELYVNDEKVLTGNGEWTASLKLKEGKNDITIVATNKFGKSKTVLKSITLK